MRQGGAVHYGLRRMRKIVVLGRGGAGKSTLAVRLGAILAAPVIELDKHFWAPDLTPTSKDQWEQIQRRLVGGDRWVIDGDLGPYDVLDVRLRAADTVIVLDFPLWRCASRALRRSRENLAFWRWVVTYRRRSLPTVMDAIARCAADAELHVLRSPHAVEQLLNRAIDDI
jgi:adenylate kinase family enzyme